MWESFTLPQSTSWYVTSACESWNCFSFFVNLPSREDCRGLFSSVVRLLFASSWLIGTPTIGCAWNTPPSSTVLAMISGCSAAEAVVCFAGSFAGWASLFLCCNPWWPLPPLPHSLHRLRRRPCSHGIAEVDHRTDRPLQWLNYHKLNSVLEQHGRISVFFFLWR